MGREEWLALGRPLADGWLTQGPRVKEFEAAFAARHQVARALGVSSCTTALHLALAALGLAPGDRVIVPSFTWVATANAVEYCGARPVFCDSGLDGYNIDPEGFRRTAARLAAEKTPAVAAIVVHLFGLTADMEPIMAVAREYGLKIIEDAACASGAGYRGRPAGGLADVGCFSFHPRKIITTGEGGMCTTDNEALAARMACLRSHGAGWSEERRHLADQPYLMSDFDELGYNYRLTDLQGALGLVQLARLDGFIAERRSWALWYQRELAGLVWLKTPSAPEGFEHSWQSFVTFVRPGLAPAGRDEIMARLHQGGVGCRAGTHAIHQLGYYRRKYGLKEADFPNAALLAAQTLALPLHNQMTPNDYQRVVDALKSL
ncbi:MAG: DegT/DnrJ/EryC1/StrS family aminotransferase [Candidatus Adiutrix sp.]|nr:DegT/DnrJ/EryC1/StrS family aminotransferase [Candidatus Adiutrix sp.]